MKILLDNGTSWPIAKRLTGHEVTFSRRIGWHELKNGELIQRAEEAGYDLLLSTDKNIRYQQNLAGRKIALVVLGNSQWPEVQLHGRDCVSGQFLQAVRLYRGGNTVPLIVTSSKFTRFAASSLSQTR